MRKSNRVCSGWSGSCCLFQTLKSRYAMLAVTHSPDQKRRLADRVMVLREGKCVATMSRSQIEDPEHSHKVMEAFF